MVKSGDDGILSFNLIISTKIKGEHMRAFWKYDLFPYCLSSQITKYIIKDGKNYVGCASYGVGHIFTPFQILSDKKGKNYN